MPLLSPINLGRTAGDPSPPPGPDATEPVQVFAINRLTLLGIPANSVRAFAINRLTLLRAP